jgi:hypothetical protein
VVDREGGQWNVATKNDAVYLERVSETGDRLFEALLDAEEARDLAELLAKHAGKLEESDDPEESGESDESKESEESDESP